ncbi:MAG TPA: hypothetical protein VG759_03575 [Candidatus Angelobacter sp.]|jgi:hypothetical protein|nr:hypothetical protein [Candidatus Angelobacter sp.]
MIPISSDISSRLVWSKSPHKHGYELKRNGEMVGSLQRTSFWSSEFQAESVHRSWKLRRTGGFSTEIVDSNSDTRIAVINSHWSGGTLEFSDGRTYRLIYKGFFRPVWTVLTDSGQTVLSLDSREKTVELAKGLDLSEDRMILLAIFAWHVMQQISEDAALTGAVIAAAAS